jgi:hypothetical protein
MGKNVTEHLDCEFNCGTDMRWCDSAGTYNTLCNSRDGVTRIEPFPKTGNASPLALVTLDTSGADKWVK